MELADDIEEVKTTCFYCNKKAILNLKHVNGVADTSGPVVQLGAEEKYFPTCFSCYYKHVNAANQSPVKDWSPSCGHPVPAQPVVPGSEESDED